MRAQELRHLISDTPRVMVVDGSKMVRKMIADVLKRELPGVEVIGCASVAGARKALGEGAVHLVTTSLARWASAHCSANQAQLEWASTR